MELNIIDNKLNKKRRGGKVSRAGEGGGGRW